MMKRTATHLQLKTGHTQQLKIALEPSIAWGYKEFPFKLFTFRSPSCIKYIEKDNEYIFFLLYHTGYRNNIYVLYSPGEPHSDNINENFYIWPMLVQGDLIEVPVQYYGSIDIIKKKFKYEEILNLYK